jgi:uncharacterized membrane protein
MPPASTVVLSQSITAKWPDVCVCCERTAPGSIVTLKVIDDRWLAHWAPMFAKKIDLRVSAPACPQCAVELHRRRMVRNFMRTLAIIAVAAATYFTFRHFGWLATHPSRRIVLVVTAAALCVPLAVLMQWIPPRIRLNLSKGRIAYEFRSQRLAEQFRDANAVLFV